MKTKQNEKRKPKVAEQNAASNNATNEITILKMIGAYLNTESSSPKYSAFLIGATNERKGISSIGRITSGFTELSSFDQLFDQPCQIELCW